MLLYKIYVFFTDGILNPEVVPKFSFQLGVMKTQFFSNLIFSVNSEQFLRRLIK